MSLWNREVEPLLRAASGRDVALRHASAICVEHAVRRVADMGGVRPPKDDVDMLLAHLESLVRYSKSSGDQVLAWPDLERLEAALPDPDSELHSRTGWGCAFEAVLDLARTLRHKYVADSAADTINLAYQTVTRGPIQAAMDHAMDEYEYMALEESIPQCRAEIEFQTGVLRAL